MKNTKMSKKLQVDEEFSDHSSDNSSARRSSSTDDEASPPPKSNLAVKKKKKIVEKKSKVLPSRRRKTPGSETDEEEKVQLSPKKHQKKQVAIKEKDSKDTENFHTRRTPKPSAKVPLVPANKKPNVRNNSTVQKPTKEKAKGASTTSSGDDDKVKSTAKTKKKKPKAKKVANPPPSSESDEDNGPCAAPKCILPDEKNVNWVQCDGCQGWFHYKCMGLMPDDILEDEEYYCVKCCKIYRLANHNNKAVVQDC